MTPARLAEIRARSGIVTPFESNIGFSGLGKEEAEELILAVEDLSLQNRAAMVLIERISKESCQQEAINSFKCKERVTDWGPCYSCLARTFLEQHGPDKRKCPSTYRKGEFKCEKDEGHLNRRGDVPHQGGGQTWLTI